MATSSPIPEEAPSESRPPSASAKRTGRRSKGKRPMFDTLAVTKELRESGLASAPAEAIVAAFGTIAGNVATRDDLRDFATRDDLRDFATKDDLKNFATKDDLKNFATKDDLKNFATKDDLRALEERMATKDDLRNFATKDDLKAIEKKMERMVTKDDLQYYATEASLLKAVGELRQEMSDGFDRMHRFLIQVAMGTVTVNIAMVTAIFVIAKYLV